MPDAYDEALRHQVLVEGYKEEETDEYMLVLPLLGAAFMERIDALGVDRINEASLPRLQRTIRGLTKDNEKIASKQNKVFFKRLEAFSAYEVDFEQKSLRNQEVTPWAYTGKRAFSDSQDTPMSADGTLLDEFALFWVAAHSYRIKGLLQRAWAEGITTAEVIKQVRGTKSRRYKDGLLGRLAMKDIPGMVRTAIAHVSSTARIAVMKVTPGVSSYRWVSVLDSRTSEICRSLSGRVFKFGQGPRPPAHFNCRSHIVAVLDRNPDASAPDQTYYQWLKTQSAKFQDSVLGPSRGKLLRDGGISAEKFAQLSLDRNFRPMTLQRMKELEPEIFKRAGVKPRG